ncbi:MAG: sulfatase-like hydrolase/transferase [Ferruginibacter sp.]
MVFFSKMPRLIRWIFSVMLVFLVIMTLYRFIFFFHYRGEHRPFSGSAFLLGLRFDAKFISMLGLGILLLCGIPFLDPFRNRKAIVFWVAFLSLIFFITLIFLGADFYHYDYLKQKLNASVLNFLQDAGISFKMMSQSYPLIKISIALLLLVWLYAWWQKRSLDRITVNTNPVTKKKGNVFYYIGFVLLLGGLTFGKLGQFPLRWSDAFLFADDFKASTALNPFQSFFSTLGFKNSGYDIKKVKQFYPLMASMLEIKNPDQGKLDFERSYAPTDSFVKKPNIVLVICESFSAYKSSMYGNPLNTTPYFNELCRNGVFFDRCFTPAFGTARGVWATITGIPDVQSPSTASRNPAAVDQHTIINNFYGYEHLYFLGGDPTWANIQGLLSNNINGLHIYSQDNFKAKKVDVWGISDKNLFLEANSILKEKTDPFFAIIQTADNHRPFTIPDEDKEDFKLLDMPEAALKNAGFENNAELNAFRFTDFCYQEFMEAAKKEKYFDNTIFVFVGDHGIRGNAADMFPKSWTAQGLTCEHVPLLFYAPKLLTAKRIHTVSSQVDILPSIGALARITYRNNTFGRNLFDTAGARQHYAFIIDHDVKTIGLVSDRYYFVKNIKTGKQEFVSVTGNEAIIPGPGTDSIRNRMQAITDAWNETAKYLLLNNKKKN